MTIKTRLASLKEYLLFFLKWGLLGIAMCYIIQKTEHYAHKYFVRIAAALGLVGLFCCVTNSPLAAILLSFEMFGSANIYQFCLICVITFALSGHGGLYASQILRFSKAHMQEKSPAAHGHQ